jgi:VanZ family protein
MRNLRLLRLWWICGLLLVALVVYGSLAPRPYEFPVVFWDKAQHLIAYAVLGIWFGAIYKRRHYFLLSLILVALGVLLEFIHRDVGRDFQVMDMVADALGVALGVSLAATPLGDMLHWVESVWGRLQT